MYYLVQGIHNTKWTRKLRLEYIYFFFIVAHHVTFDIIPFVNIHIDIVVMIVLFAQIRLCKVALFVYIRLFSRRRWIYLYVNTRTRTFVGFLGADQMITNMRFSIRYCSLSRLNSVKCAIATDMFSLTLWCFGMYMYVTQTINRCCRQHDYLCVRD